MGIISMGRDLGLVGGSGSAVMVRSDGLFYHRFTQMFGIHCQLYLLISSYY